MSFEIKSFQITLMIELFPMPPPVNPSTSQNPDFSYQNTDQVLFLAVPRWAPPERLLCGNTQNLRSSDTREAVFLTNSSCRYHPIYILNAFKIYMIILNCPGWRIHMKL